MGYYYDPPQELPKVARQLTGKDETYEDLRNQLADGEKLFGHYDRYIFQNAVWLFSAEEMEEFERQHLTGQILRLGFYAMPEETFEEHFGHIGQVQN